VHGLHVSTDAGREKRLRERWTHYSRGVPLVMLPSPYRSLVDPVVEHIEEIQEREPRTLVTVVIPEFVPREWWARLLHGHAGLLLALRLHEHEDVVVTNVPYHLKSLADAPPTEEPATNIHGSHNGHHGGGHGGGHGEQQGSVHGEPGATHKAAHTTAH
jgi:hypothetical protein